MLVARKNKSRQADNKDVNISHIGVAVLRGQFLILNQQRIHRINNTGMVSTS